MLFIYQPIYWKILNINTNEILNTKCPRSLDPIYILNYNMKLVKTSWTLSTGYFKIIHSKLTDKFTTHWRVLWLHFFYIMKNVKKLLKKQITCPQTPQDRHHRHVCQPLPQNRIQLDQIWQPFRSWLLITIVAYLRYSSPILLICGVPLRPLRICNDCLFNPSQNL